VEAAAALLRSGGLVAFPTETVYGLGADALNPEAVSRVFEAKERPLFDPLIVHISERSQVSEVAASIPQTAWKLMDRFWPGPLTLLMPKKDSVPDLVTAGLDSVGIRIPDHPFARLLIALADCPVAAPSANLFGRVSPTTAQHVAEQLGDRIDLILDGGPCRVGVESTVLDLLTKPPTIRRPGGATAEDISAVIGEVQFRDRALSGAAAPAPGMLDQHYAPHTPVRICEADQHTVPAGRVGLLTLQPVAEPGRFAAVEVLSSTGSLVEAAARLYAALRLLDRLDLDVILASRFPEHGLGRAINDRLRRAAATR
jgi:L-threonylcarbamoyladenylate synthase